MLMLIAEFYSGVYFFKDDKLIIILGAKYYNHPELFEIDLEEAIDSLLLKIDNRFIFNEENCSSEYPFKYLNLEE